MTHKQIRILVCGGSGFIGTNLIETLLKYKNYKIFNIDKISYCSIPNNFKNYKNNKNYYFYKLDIKEIKKIQKIIKKNNISVVINLANDSHVDKSIEDPYNFILNNIKSNLKFIDFLSNLQIKKEGVGVHYIHLSTDEVYGDYKKKPNNENDKLEPNSPYSVSKAAIEIILNSYNKTFGFKYLILRTCNQFGKFQFPEKFIPTIINSIKNDKKIPLYGDGLNKREWMHVDILSSIIYKIIKKKIFNKKKIINVGSGKIFTNKEIIKKIINIFNKKFNKNFSEKKIDHVHDRPGHDKHYSINNEVLKKLNINKNFDMDIYLQKTIRWYIQNEKWIKHTKKKYNGKRQGLI